MTMPDPNRRLREIVRNFPENGMKLLLESPRNVQDLLGITGARLIQWIDFERLTLEPTVFIKCDYRHVGSDLVFKAPFRFPEDSLPEREVLLYILVEHQSEPARMTPLNVADYAVQIYVSQRREWEKKHGSLARLRFHPVLPVVLYTGLRRWETPGSLVDLVELGELFAPHIPGLEPLFVNLPATPPRVLEARGGFFGWVLRLVQRRRDPTRTFRVLLRRVVRQLETMPSEERFRWLEFLSYIHALVYHHRNQGEVPVLERTIDASVQTDDHRRELDEMGKSYAEVLKEEGREKGLEQGEIRALRNTLLRQLRRRFGELPTEITQRIEETVDTETLEAWLDRFVTASALEELGI
jgi:ElaB/YqjD/DUF883 family membrane-anchored ribosome-binding protein